MPGHSLGERARASSQLTVTHTLTMTERPTGVEGYGSPPQRPVFVQSGERAERHTEQAELNRQQGRTERVSRETRAPAGGVSCRREPSAWEQQGLQAPNLSKKTLPGEQSSLRHGSPGPGLQGLLRGSDQRGGPAGCARVPASPVSSRQHQSLQTKQEFGRATLQEDVLLPDETTRTQRLKHRDRFANGPSLSTFSRQTLGVLLHTAQHTSEIHGVLLVPTKTGGSYWRPEARNQECTDGTTQQRPDLYTSLGDMAFTPETTVQINSTFICTISAHSRFSGMQLLCDSREGCPVETLVKAKK